MQDIQKRKWKHDAYSKECEAIRNKIKIEDLFKKDEKGLETWKR